METQLPFTILSQPTETTCGPTCLHAIYNYYHDPLPLKQVIDEIRMLDDGGTFAVLLACHAMRRGYKATIFTYNLQMFDPIWFEDPSIDLTAKLKAQARYKKETRLQVATEGYCEFLAMGGKLKLRDMSPSLIRKYLNRGVPVLTGLSSTYLHRTPREYGPDCDFDDIRGEPSGHFVVLYGYNKLEKSVYVAEPLNPNPIATSQYYSVRMDRVINVDPSGNSYL